MKEQRESCSVPLNRGEEEEQRRGKCVHVYDILIPSRITAEEIFTPAQNIILISYSKALL